MYFGSGSHFKTAKVNTSEIRLHFPGDHTYNGEETDGNRTFSEGEGDTSRATDPDSTFSPKREKKKRSGLRTPSFLKKKKKDKKSSKERPRRKTNAAEEREGNVREEDELKFEDRTEGRNFLSQRGKDQPRSH